MASTAEQPATDEAHLKPIKTIRLTYCQICSFPPEYCEYGTSISKCKKWLSDHDKIQYEKIYGATTKSIENMIRTVERTKRKRITTIHGLDLFGVDLKKLAKLFASKFATGSSVTKNNQGEDEIVIQGDVSDDVLDLFDSTTGKFAELIGNGKIPDDNIVFVDDTKKKKPT
ncbi:hypothetical protein KEM48_007915 [Puccinia striiformis f. sp. tritici PST-130]|nr:hypothetical protein KEM48_007915 [Puccinia striiformis f. sp. tritici PST-130]